MISIYKKELGHYFNNPFGYIVVGLFGILANFLFVKDVFAIGSASLRPFFSFSIWLMVVFVPAVCMRTFSEEKRNNTLELLMTLPIRERDIVLGKFFACWTVSVISLSLTLGLPISLSFLSSLYIPEIIMGYMGLILSAGLITAISLFFSLKTSNQIVAFFCSVTTVFFLYAFSSDFVAGFIPRIIAEPFSIITPLQHTEAFTKGIIDLRSILYFLTSIGGLLVVIEYQLRQKS